MVAYPFVLVVKLVSVLGFAGGAIASLSASEPGARRRAAHRIASPCLFLTWASGYLLLLLAGLPLFELWSVGALVLSLAANFVLAAGAARERPGWGTRLGVAVPIVLTVGLMVFKPTWAQVAR